MVDDAFDLMMRFYFALFVLFNDAFDLMMRSCLNLMICLYSMMCFILKLAFHLPIQNDFQQFPIISNNFYPFLSNSKILFKL